MSGVNEYFPILFTKECASLFNCMVHSTILEYKARKMPLWKMHQNEGIQVELLNDQVESFVKPCPKSLGEFMFWNF